MSSKDSVEGDLLIGIVKIKPGQHIEPDQIVFYVNGKMSLLKNVNEKNY